MESVVLKALIDAGVGSFIALFILVGLYRITSKLGGQFIKAQQAQATALGEQAAAMRGLTDTIQDSLAKDNTEHREIIIMLKVINEKLKNKEGGPDES